MKLTAVIMAGGRGERFWPESRAARPKQFLSLTPDGATLLQKAVRRLSPLVTPEDVYVVTNSDYTGLVAEQLPEVPAENVIAEPCSRNTAPCIGLAAGILRKRCEDAVMLVMPSDHLIADEEGFLDVLRRAARTAEETSALVTLGVTPDYPETGYGYIRYDRNSGKDGVYSVERFVEKPDAATAEAYLREGGYLWNSGMFIWKTSAILTQMERLMPELSAGLQPIVEAYGTAEFGRVLAERFGTLPSESVDYGIMEKAEHICTLPCSFGWNDAGSWLALERIRPSDEHGNTLSGDVVSVNSRNCTVSGGKRLVTLLGVEDLVVVDTPDALLVCSKRCTQDIKQLLAQLKAQNRTEL